MASSDNDAAPGDSVDPSTDAVGAGAYDILRARLLGQAADLQQRGSALNTRRIDTFGSSRFEVAGIERIRTENNSVARDILAIGDDLLFGFNVFIGLKAETSIDDVFSVHRYRSEDNGLTLESSPVEHSWLHSPEFQSDFHELYTYYKETRLLQLQRREGRLLAAFQTGRNIEDVRVFRWSVTPDGTTSYIDNRGERDYQRAPQFDFEWQSVDRSQYVEGRNPHVNIENRVFVDPTGGDFTIRLEDNTANGEVVLVEPVVDADQALADATILYAVLGDLVALSVQPYREEAPRGYVVNTFTRSARRNDDILTSCRQLPEDHGIITPSGYELRTGEAKSFEVATTGMRFEEVRRSPNGEDVLYVFHERTSGLSILLPYNLIRREIGQPISAHGHTIFDDGSLIVFREDAEPTRVHPMQFWNTPFVSDEVHAQRPVDDSLLERIGNADLVRGISDVLNIARQVHEAEPSAVVYGDLTASAGRVLDGFYWLDEEEAGGLAETLREVRSTSALIIDEFEKVQELQSHAVETLDAASSEVAELQSTLLEQQPASATAFVDGLRDLRRQRGHLVTIKDTRYIDLAEVERLETDVVRMFERLSQQAVDFFADDAAFAEFHTGMAEYDAEIASAVRATDLSDPQRSIEELSEGIDVLTQVVSSLEIDDPTVRTDVLARVSDVLAGLNRSRALAENKRKQLVTSEGAAAFSVEMTLLSQAVSSELARANTPEAADEALGRLLLQLEDLETRFAEFDDELVEVGKRRDEIYETLSGRKQSLLDERQRGAQRLVDAADRILSGIGRRIERFDDTDEMNAWFVSDPMVEKVRSLADGLREINQATAADELVRRLDSAREDAGRSLRDRADIFEDGGKVVRFGKHRFSRDTAGLELTVGVFDDSLHGVLTGTDYRERLDSDVLDGSSRFWSQHLVSETAEMSRAEFLASSIVLDALDGGSARTFDELMTAHNAKDGLLEVARLEAERRVDEGYERGVHDHDAARILDGMLEPLSRAGLLRYSPRVRADAIDFWTDGLDIAARDSWRARARSLGRLRDQFERSPVIASTIGELSALVDEHGRSYDPWLSAEYLFEELAEPVLTFDTSRGAIELADAFRAHQEAGDSLAAEIDALAGNQVARLELASAWFTAFAGAQAPDRVALVPEAVMIVTTEDLPRRPADVAMQVAVDGLLDPHPRVNSGSLTFRVDELLTTVASYRRHEIPAFDTYLQTRSLLLDTLRTRLRLDEFAPKVMSSFVRNQLIDQVYLPLIGDNLAKQVGSLDSGRTDQMGLLLLISPPGYGKTTLMEYVANRLGMVFVKVNGPALGTGVTSLDPNDAPDATAAQEVDKINFALEMGSNVMLYLDDIQHTNPELLQKFISMTDAQRRMEGVWKGRTRTYDLRGKRFAVVMAGNPYTESGERFAIPDMLANRADTYNLGDVLSGREDVFALSYIENALASNTTLKPMTTHDLSDVAKLVAMASDGEASLGELSHPYSPVELTEMVSTMERLLTVQHVLLAVNRSYIASASMADDFRTEPAFQLQGSYRNMARLAEKISPVMNDDEIDALIADHYRGEAQTLTTGTEANLLKLAELRGSMTAEQDARWDEIKATFQRTQRRGGSDTDPMLLVAESLREIGSTLREGVDSKFDR